MKQNTFSKSGFTLIEMLIVIVIIGIITSLSYYGWQFSKQKAQVAEVAKNARSMKDYLDIQSFEGKARIQKIARLTNRSTATHKLLDADNLSTTHYFINKHIPDNGAVYHCHTDETRPSCYILDDKEYRYSFLIYFIGNTTDCTLDEALWMENTSADDRSLPKRLKTKNPNDPNFRRYNRLTIDWNHQDISSNYCLLPIKAPMEVVTTP